MGLGGAHGTLPRVWDGLVWGGEGDWGKCPCAGLSFQAVHPGYSGALLVGRLWPRNAFPSGEQPLRLQEAQPPELPCPIAPASNALPGGALPGPVLPGLFGAAEGQGADTGAESRMRVLLVLWASVSCLSNGHDLQLLGGTKDQGSPDGSLDHPRLGGRCHLAGALPPGRPGAAGPW